MEELVYEVDKETKGADSRDKVKHNERINAEIDRQPLKL